MSHSFTIVSELPEARHLPFALTATAMTSLACPARVSRFLLVATSQSYARNRLSGVNSTEHVRQEKDNHDAATPSAARDRCHARGTAREQLAGLPVNAANRDHTGERRGPPRTASPRPEEGRVDILLPANVGVQKQSKQIQSMQKAGTIAMSALPPPRNLAPADDQRSITALVP
jgi:hypothetical protein